MPGRSHAVHVTLVGIAGMLLAARLVSGGQQMRRNLYGSRADCERDYSAQQCAPDSGSHSSGWHGPYYNANRYSSAARGDPGPGRYGLQTAFARGSIRAGFGAFGRAMRAGG